MAVNGFREILKNSVIYSGESGMDNDTTDTTDTFTTLSTTVDSSDSMTNLEKEENVNTKSDLSNIETVTVEDDGDRIDDLDNGESKEISDGILTKNEDGTVHCKSDYLGEFDYDPELFAYGYKEIQEDDGTTSKLPILKYVGNSGTDGAGSEGTLLQGVLGDKTLGGMNYTCDSTFELPEGLKSGDYTFEGNEDLIFQPRLPDSLKSGHYMFANCTKLEYGSSDAKDGESFGNIGGEIYFPDGFEDGSGMYKGSSEFKGDFGDEPESLTNVQEMFDGTSVGAQGEGQFALYKHKAANWNGKDSTEESTEKSTKESTNLSWAEAVQNVVEQNKEEFAEMTPIKKITTIMSMTNPVCLGVKAGEVVVEKFTGNKDATYENTDTKNQSSTTSKKLGAVNSTTKDTESQSTQDTSQSSSKSTSKSKSSERIYGDGTANSRSLPTVASYSNDTGYDMELD